MEHQIIPPPEVKQLRGLAFYEAMRDMIKYVSDYLKNGGTMKELEEQGFKFGKVDLRDKANQSA